LIADTVESFGDIASPALVWGGLAISARPPEIADVLVHVEPAAGAASR
jgi:divalent metal cation (Fe/Co/Zn/Cd) transporter